jgi:hypothetical protein
VLEPNSSAAIIVWEDLWAANLAEALRRADAVVVERHVVPYDLVQAAVAYAEESKAGAPA